MDFPGAELRTPNSFERNQALQQDVFLFQGLHIRLPSTPQQFRPKSTFPKAHSARPVGPHRPRLTHTLQGLHSSRWADEQLLKALAARAQQLSHVLFGCLDERVFIKGWLSKIEDMEGAPTMSRSLRNAWCVKSQKRREENPSRNILELKGVL